MGTAQNTTQQLGNRQAVCVRLLRRYTAKRPPALGDRYGETASGNRLIFFFFFRRPMQASLFFNWQPARCCLQTSSRTFLLLRAQGGKYSLLLSNRLNPLFVRTRPSPLSAWWKPQHSNRLKKKIFAGPMQAFLFSTGNRHTVCLHRHQVGPSCRYEHKVANIPFCTATG